MIKANLTEAQLRTLQRLAEELPDTAMVLIGASALGQWIEMRWRRTDDLDVTLSLSLEEFPSTIGAIAGWRHDPSQEQRWYTEQHLKIDLLPAGQAHLDAGEVVWPKSGARMSLRGFRHLFRAATPLELAPGLVMPVAPVHLLALIKMTSYLDRPYERQRDLEDLAHIFEDLLPSWDERRAEDDLLDAGIDYEQAGAYWIGREIGRLVDDAEAALVDEFLAKAAAEDDPHTTRHRFLAAAPLRWRGNEDELDAMLEALKRGLTRGRALARP